MRPTPHTTRELLWQHTDGVGLEFARVSESDTVVQIDGTVLGVRGGVPYRLRYAINCAPSWIVQAVVVSVVCVDLDDCVAPEAPWIRNAAGGFSCSLKHDGAGHWSNTVGGAALPDLDGCTTVDLAGAVLTNTLALRASATASFEVGAAWIDGPRQGMPLAARQRYTALGGGAHRYENLRGGADLTFTADGGGFVLDYPGVARRIAG